MSVASTRVAFAQQHARRLQKRVDLFQQRLGKLVLLQQVAKAQERGRVGRALPRPQAQEGPQRQAVVGRLLERLVTQPVPARQQIKAQHPLQPDRRTAPRAPGVKGGDPGDEAPPRHQLLHAARGTPRACPACPCGGCRCPRGRVSSWWVAPGTLASRPRWCLGCPWPRAYRPPPRSANLKSGFPSVNFGNTPFMKVTFKSSEHPPENLDVALTLPGFSLRFQQFVNGCAEAFLTTGGVRMFQVEIHGSR